MERKDLEEIAKIVIEKDILVMSDEIYAALTYKEKHTSIIENRRNERKEQSLSTVFQKACNDRLATWLCLRSKKKSFNK